MAGSKESFSIFSTGSHFVQESNFGRWQFCEIILDLDQRFRCHLKIFPFYALVAILFSAVELFMQFLFEPVVRSIVRGAFNM